MATRTVRLDKEAEEALAKLQKMTGLSISEVLKRGLMAYETATLEGGGIRPYDVYRTLDLGDGGYAVAPASDAKAAVAEAIRRKHRR
jgi:hypothetical protein